ARPRLRLHAVAARRRAAWLRLPGGAVFGELLRAAGQRRTRIALAPQDAGRDPQARPAVAEPRPLHGGRCGYRACHGQEPLAHCNHGIVELVALVSDREALSAMA